MPLEDIAVGGFSRLWDCGSTTAILVIGNAASLFACWLLFKRNASLADKALDLIPDATEKIRLIVLDFKEGMKNATQKED